jgi:hypothetical protein
MTHRLFFQGGWYYEKYSQHFLAKSMGAAGGLENKENSNAVGGNGQA